MARDHLFVKQVAALHTRYGTPARAIALQATLASLLVAIGTFDAIIAYFFFATVVFIALTVAAIFVLRRKHRSSGEAGAATYRTPGYPVTPLFFLLVIIVMLFLLAMNDPLHAFLGVGVVLLGVPVYQVVLRKKVAGE